MSSQQELGQIEQAVTKLFNALRSGGSDEFKQYLKFTSNFHKYSLNNRFLIYFQMENASRVASYKKWQSLGRQVKKGEKAIKILAPIVRNRASEVEGEEREKVFFFKSVSVFDISQTEGLEVPQWDVRPHDSDNDQGLYALLKKQVEKLGYKVIEEEMDVLGRTDGKTLWINPKQTLVDKFLTLLHELTHALLHFGSDRPSLTTSVKECQAEAATYVVAAQFGLETPISAEYLICWGNKEEELLENLSKVMQASKQILDLLVDSDNQENADIQAA